MPEQAELLDRLRAADSLAALEPAGAAASPAGAALLDEFAASGVKFATSRGLLDRAWRKAVELLALCVDADAAGRPVLQEGGVYRGCWLESTGTINAEVLARFCPQTAEATFRQFADLQREDGLIPYKVTGGSAVFKQIQLVTPPARSVWHHYLLDGRDKAFLVHMYRALARYDEWLARHRNTRGTGCVEAFCAFDTGHDLSPRFWHIPDTPYRDDPAACDPDSPLLPLLAPDLTASVFCGRRYLARMAAELGDEAAAARWRDAAEETRRALMRHCYDEADGFFYDVDSCGRFIRIQSDVLLHVLACEAADDGLFAASLERYLLNTRKFFAKYPFTPIAMDDPRFDPHAAYNTWAGAVNFLSLLRAPRAFDHYGRFVELTWVIHPILAAMARIERFGQVLSPWTGAEGYTEAYSPAILCLLDYVERLCSILPAPEGELWFTGLLPKGMDHGVQLADETAYSRMVDGHRYELHNTRETMAVCKDGRLLLTAPAGVRVVTDRSGALRGVIGMTVRPVEGVIRTEDAELPFCAEGNAVLRYVDGRLLPAASPGVVFPNHG
ncbi:MAG: hypothetical protein C6W55_00125 [Thermobacillus sp.]|uniref:MGH1-like glycoside hydrolase domain-containing protein n=1 Tax=Thermobacillus sp. TaxID=2108467 RepID=UPI000E373261|nr:hypothetical protein [Thermobacillus sp.]REK60084.1 MAG: hypothetical protein C6W55_00125 [Thermobacillus sp.]